ncbi:MAG: Eco57I restriction-modification methylase domain-containing protein [Desulfomonilaceae bacterium]
MSFDVTITARDVQELSSADSVTAFFARLGWRTEVRIEQSPGNLGITAAGTVKPIKKIELIADQDGALQVYIFQLASVTIAHTRAIVRAFRERTGNYLAILTSAYDRLDFVLVEKYLPSRPAGRSIGVVSVSVRPRVLSVDRRKPATIDLRVLRRFNYTESDPYAQYDKLLSAYSIADWSEEHFNNRALFSDYYLAERLPNLAEWQEDPKPAYVSLSKTYQRASTRLANKTVETIQSHLFEPVIQTLGFHLKKTKHRKPGAAEPSYGLYAGVGDNKAICTALVYPWGRYLDGKDYTRDADTADENPGAVVVSILERGETPWAIVTNGRIWRLYSAKAHSRATNYYEIDVEELLSQDTSEFSDLATAFRYFWLLFRKQSFVGQAQHREGRAVVASFLDQLFNDSENYAKELGDRLKERIFEDIFPHISDGFISFILKRDGAQADLSQEALDDVFQGTLSLLYRILFLLYAEARDLLPVKEVRGYYEASLKKIKEEVADIAGKIVDEVEQRLKKGFRNDEYGLFERLMKLFRVLDSGDATLNVPFYNGGLFLSNPEKDDETPEAVNARFLNSVKLADRYLAGAIDLLARDLDRKTQALAFIDYKSLGVRQLGSIYEGLLEFRLRIALEKMAIVKGKKTEEIVPYCEAVKEKRQILTIGRGKFGEERVLPKGTVYLENDKRERKATGSYYTPDHIVKYIVENTVGPVLTDKFEALRPKLRKAQTDKRAFDDRQKAFTKAKMKLEPEIKADLIGQGLVDELFDVKVLDPAMGSGHFLVEAVDFITDKTLDFLNAFPWNPLSVHLAKMRQEIMKEMENLGITIDANRLSDVNLLKRHILKRCIYGVDLNPMAVELAKVSLWLDCFTLGAPLSFLDHHIKCGNSLIGVTVDDVKDKLQESIQADEEAFPLLTGILQSSFAGIMSATEFMRKVGEQSDLTIWQVKQSREKFREALDTLAPFKGILDVYTSQWFGNAPSVTGQRKSDRSRNPSIEFLKSSEAQVLTSAKESYSKISDSGRKVLRAAKLAAKDRRFFHWELEFPEVYYEKGQRKHRPGFDAVIGNPPYVGFHGAEDTKPYMRQRYVTCVGKFDTYVPFWERALAVARHQGRVGFINPSGFMKRDHGSKLRELILKTTVERIHDFLHECVFEGAINYVCVLAILKDTPENNHGIRFTSGKTLDLSPSSLPQSSLTAESWITVTEKEDIHIKVSETSSILRLSDIADVVAEGIVTGHNEVFLTHEQSEIGQNALREKIGRCALRGDSVDRYEFKWDGTVLIYPYFWFKGKTVALSEEDFRHHAPKTYEYLCRNRAKLAGRKWFERSSKKWFELWNQRNLLHQEATKLVIQENSVRCELGFDQSRFFYLDTCCGISPREDSGLSKWYLLAILNSALIDRVFRQSTVPKAQGHFIHKPMFLKNLPIRVINFATSQNERAKLVKELLLLYRDDKFEELLSRVKILLAGNEDQSSSKFNKGFGSYEDVVHDLMDLLASEMDRLNQAKQKGMNSFLHTVSSLSLPSGSMSRKEPLEHFKGKSLLKNFLGDYQKRRPHLSFDEIWASIERNKSLINHPSLPSKETLRSEYDRVLTTLLPLKERLQRTDALLDKIVCHLYGVDPTKLVMD